MSELRHRKLRDADDLAGSSKSRPGRRSSKPSSIQRKFLLLTIAVLFTLVFYLVAATTLFHPVVEHIAYKLGYHEPVYGVIIDAGSTGSRVLAYTLHKTYIGGDLVLDDELFQEIKPGLSSYVDTPNEGAKSILKLVDLARTVIPEEFRSSTPLLLRATAGLRLLDPVAADNLLNSVREVLYSSGFQVSKDAVDIMDGVDEGICSWFTVNFLQDKLSHDRTSAALDLGGGSTQITYEPHGSETPGPIISLPGPHRNISLYTYSYLNLGLMAARRGVLLAENEPSATNVVSECINPIVKDHKWRYSNIDFYVNGPQKDVSYKHVKETSNTVSVRIPIVRADRCNKIISDLIKKLLPPAPPPTNLAEQHINAFSYYFDRAAEAGLIDPFRGGVITVNDFIDAATKECNMANVDQPWACLDLTYISTLLQEAFHLSPDTKLELVKKINGHEISWALGLAFNTLMKNSQ